MVVTFEENILQKYVSDKIGLVFGMEAKLYNHLYCEAFNFSKLSPGPRGQAPETEETAYNANLLFLKFLITYIICGICNCHDNWFIVYT